MAAEQLTTVVPAERPMVDRPSVLVVTAGSPTGECGVADYASRLVEALNGQGVKAQNFPILRLLDIPRACRTVDPSSIVHVQYPLLAWRKSAIPIFLMGWLRLRGHRRLALTIHEFRRAHWARRLVCVLLARLSTTVLGTSAYEAGALKRWLAVDAKLEVVPIASNIPIARLRNPPSTRHGLSFFGLLAPDKGLERFIEIASPSLGNNVPVTVIGTVVQSHEAWLQSLRERHPQVRFRLALSPEEVSASLQETLIALLPYPDGISERRGSALAALAHGLQVVSTHGPATTADLAAVCHLVNATDEARARVASLLTDPATHIGSDVIRRYVDERSWDAIARRHALLYRALIERCGVVEWK